MTRTLIATRFLRQSMDKYSLLGRGQSFLTTHQKRAVVRSLSSTSSPSSSNKAKMHSSATVAQSTTTMDFTHSAVSAQELSGAKTPAPSMKELRKLFIASAIPMVGFGAIDNIVLIQAGHYIDSTLGLALGLATMSAAAAGQVVSDVFGVVSEGPWNASSHD